MISIEVSRRRFRKELHRLRYVFIEYSKQIILDNALSTIDLYKDKSIHSCQRFYNLCPNFLYLDIMV